MLDKTKDVAKNDVGAKDLAAAVEHWLAQFDQRRLPGQVDAPIM